ncbi:MAG TPA: TetR/AcrR family transcriptional regulator [Solirubrobacterales bacterium]|nr:TetR/AcrR family transcriptional regulator [Solirubrobacterales bacterium]
MATVPTRTQEERRAETRGKLLDATVHSLAEVGFAATTSRRVSELAGVSLGAQTHHFPHRVDLLGAAIEWAAQRRVDELREIAADLPGEPSERLGALLDIIWNDFSSPTFDVFVKLWVAAADDPDLYARLVPAEARLTAEIASLSTEILPEGIASRRLSMALTTIRGLALTEHFEPRGRRRRDPWPETRAILLEFLLD